MTFGSIVPPGASFLENIISWSVLYSSLILVTLLWCTILIIYRIRTLSGGVAAGMRVYRRVIEILVESAALYSAVVVVLLVFEIRNEAVVVYIQELAIAIRVCLTGFNIFLLMTATSLLGNRAYDYNRPHCSRARAPRRLLEWKYHGVVTSIQKSFKFA